MSERYLYFRTVSAIGDDDARGDSAMYPLSSLQGIHPTADDSLNIFFKPMIPVHAGDPDDDTANMISADYVVINLTTANTHKDVIAGLTRLFGSHPHSDGFIDVADDVTGVYAVPGISAVSTISTAAALT